MSLSCSHLPACPGCPRFGACEPAPDALAQLRTLSALYAAQLDVRVGARRGFRHRARLAVRGRKGTPKIGVFAAGTHRVVDIPRCEIHHPLINQVASALKASMRELQLTSYSEASNAGLLRAAQVVVERSSQTAQIVLVCNATSVDSAAPLLVALQRRLGAQVHSLWWNGNSDITNRVMGPLYVRFAGPEHVVERIGGADVFFPPGAFGQNNLDLFDRMVEQIHANIPAGSHVVELYAGTGAIGLGLVQRGEAVVFNELGAASLAGLARGLEQLSAEQRGRVHVEPGPASRAARHVRRDSVVIVDPPRKGLDPEVVAALGVRAPERLFYVSCGLASFLRDAAQLAAQGLALESVTAYDLFPYTEHVETVAAFRRSSAQP